MKKYIDKDALAAEIERLHNSYMDYMTNGLIPFETFLSKDAVLVHIKNFINTLEVKEVGLIIHTIIAECCDWLAMNTNLSHDEIEGCRNLMLTVKDEQLKAQKGE